MVDNEPIKAVFTYTRDEYIRAMRRHYRKNLNVYRDVGLAILMIALGAATLYFWPQANWLFGWLVIVLGVVLLLMVVYALVILPALIYLWDPKLKWEYSLAFYEDRIEFKTQNVDSILRWQFYHSWLRDDEFYILYHGKRDVTVMPRRALTFDNSDKRFAELLKRKIGLPQTEESKT